MKPFIITLTVTAFILSSCVPAKLYSDEKKSREQCFEEKDSLAQKMVKIDAKNKELSSTLKTKDSEIKHLKSSNDSLAKTALKLTEKNNELNKLNNSLLEDKGEMVRANAEEAKKLLSEVQTAREDLQKREDQLDELERSLQKEKKRLEALKTELEVKDAEIVQKNRKISELERYLKAKDSITNLLKDKIAKALYGFEDQGLTIEQRNGKIYVSVDEKLLFQIGKSEVSPKGIEALKKLASVLEKNPDIQILVEGHTDNTGGEKLNWKLSTQRALSITYILLDNSSINEKRITAAGRGQFAPIAPNDTPDSRRKNRRSEIILTPNLDELFDIIK